MAINAANQVNVSHAGPSAKHSFHEMTPETSKIVRPFNAAATEPTPTEAPKIQSTTVKPRAKAMIFSSPDIGPNFANSSFAFAGASGESLTSGGYKTYKTKGARIKQIRPGKDAASAHCPHEIVIPVTAAAKFTDNGFAAIAVINIPDVIVDV